MARVPTNIDVSLVRGRIPKTIRPTEGYGNKSMPRQKICREQASLELFSRMDVLPPKRYHEADDKMFWEDDPLRTLLFASIIGSQLAMFSINQSIHLVTAFLTFAHSEKTLAW